MKQKFIKVTLEAQAPILGTKPDKEIFQNYLAKVHIEEDGIPPEVIAGETKEIPTDEEIGVEERGTTRFPRDGQGHVFIYDNMFKGFLKNAANVLREQTGISGYKSRVTNFVFVSPRRIYFKHRVTGEPILNADNDLKLRTKMVEVPRQGKQSVLGISQKISNATFEVVIRIIENSGKVDKSTGEEGGGKIDVKEIKDLLTYAAASGIGQWRNAGYGSLKVTSFEEIKMTDDEWLAYHLPNGPDMDEDVEE